MSGSPRCYLTLAKSTKAEKEVFIALVETILSATEKADYGEALKGMLQYARPDLDPDTRARYYSSFVQILDNTLCAIETEEKPNHRLTPASGWRIHVNASVREWVERGRVLAGDKTQHAVRLQRILDGEDTEISSSDLVKCVVDFLCTRHKPSGDRMMLFSEYLNSLPQGVVDHIAAEVEFVGRDRKNYIVSHRELSDLVGSKVCDIVGI